MFGEVERHGPSIEVNVFEWLLNIKNDRLFDTVKYAGLCLGEHPLSIEMIVPQSLLKIKNETRRFLRQCT